MKAGPVCPQCHSPAVEYADPSFELVSLDQLRSARPAGACFACGFEGALSLGAECASCRAPAPDLRHLRVAAPEAPSPLQSVAPPPPAQPGASSSSAPPARPGQPGPGHGPAPRPVMGQQPTEDELRDPTRMRQKLLSVFDHPAFVREWRFGAAGLYPDIPALRAEVMRALVPRHVLAHHVDLGRDVAPAPGQLLSAAAGLRPLARALLPDGEPLRRLDAAIAEHVAAAVRLPEPPGAPSDPFLSVDAETYERRRRFRNNGLL
eukprot:tig00001000_g6182.t1